MSLVHRKPALESLLEPLHSLLASFRTDDEISGELVEMVGFDNIDLSMELVAKRKQAVTEITAYLQGPAESSPSQRPNGRAKGKQKEGTLFPFIFDINEAELLPVTLEFVISESSGVQVLSPEDARRRMEETLRYNAARPLFTGTAVSSPESMAIDLEPDAYVTSKTRRKYSLTSTHHPLSFRATYYHTQGRNICCRWVLLQMHTR